METAKDILDRFIHHPRHLNLEEAALKFAQEIADKAWDAGAEYADECYCGKCSYCLEVRDEPAPDKSTFMKSLFPETK